MNKDIYILSVGHSGSTLLDIFLGQFEKTLSTGEMEQLTWQYYREIKNIDSKQKCTCGATFTNCNLWSEVISKMAENRNIKIDDVPDKLKIKHFDSLSIFDKPKYYKLLRRVYKDSISNKVIPRKVFSLLLKKENANNFLISKYIREVDPNINFVIDSSKNLIRYNEMKDKIDAFPIILIRNVDDIMKSQYVNGSNKFKKAWQNYYNSQVLPLIKKLDVNEYHIISYEKFIHQPKVEIEKIANKIGLDVSDFKEQVEIKNYHLVAGNPMRYEDSVKIRLKKVNEETLKNRLKANNLDSFFINRI